MLKKSFNRKKDNDQVYSYPGIPRNIQLIEMDQARNIIFKFITEKKHQVFAIMGVVPGEW